jgi:hypothetical protein
MAGNRAADVAIGPGILGNPNVSVIIADWGW